MARHMARQWMTFIWVAGWSASPAMGVSENFVQGVNLEPLKLMAVQHDGMIKTFDSLARTLLKHVDGGRVISGDDAVLSYIDMMIAPEPYRSRNILYVKKKPVRRAIANGLEGVLPQKELTRIYKTGLISPALLQRPQVQNVLAQLERDVMRTSKDVEALNGANQTWQQRVLMLSWKIIPPVSGTDTHARWSPGHVVFLGGTDPDMPTDDVHAQARSQIPLPPGFDKTKAKTLAVAWAKLESAWKAENVLEANQAIEQLAGGVASINPALYPSSGKRVLEHWYYKYKKFTWGWLLYLAAMAPLLMSTVYGWPRARKIGLTFFGLAFGLHTLAIGVRWYLAGRIPNANMFEAVTASVWFGVLIAIVIEFVKRKSPVRNLFAIGASCAAMVALMCGNFMPIQLNSDIGNIMPVLHDVWLYIHTNMIITSYAVIACAYVTAAIYLVGRMVSRTEGRVWMLMVVPSVVLGLVKWAVPDDLKGTINPAWYPFLLIVVLASVLWVVKKFLTEAARVQLAKNWSQTFHVKTFADAAMAAPTIDRRSREQVTEANRDSDAQGMERVLDGATMIFLHLSFIMLWTGTVMGAIWADHSWGRPWGWDPKEVFALNTWIIFLILVHVRIQVKEKALWTAVLAVLGTAVMLFNWIAVNFFIVGLHSYA